MRLAIALSAGGLGTTSPNPPVGCVILDRHGDVVGTGYHRRKGEPHAEANALAAAGDRATGGTAVVTLEPCNHVGRTPACRQALLDAHVTRVVIALIDPTSRDGGGAAALRAAGVDVEVGMLAEEARLTLSPWLTALDRKRPHVTVAYFIDEQGMRPLRGPQLDHLRAGTDAVLFDDGHVEEGQPDSHGRDVLTLPTQPLPNNRPADQLEILYSGGVRLLLVAGTDAAHRCLASGVVDRLTLVHPRDAGVSLARFLPPGFRLSGLAVDPDHVRIDCSSAAASTSGPRTQA